MLPVSIIVAGLMISGSIIYLVGSKNNPNPAPQAANNPSAQVADIKSLLNPGSDDVILGDPKTPDTLVEYGDYQCPWCGRFAGEVEPPFRDAYVKTGKVKMIYRNFPFLGSESFAAAGAAECAKDQGKLWAFHDAIYREEDKDKVENSGNLNQALFLKLAAEIGLDKTRFSSCLSSNKYQDKIKGEVDAARKVGVNGTPALFFNGTQIGGYIDFPTLDSQVKSLSSKK